jgi:HK97 family phage major capsid protein
MAHKLYDNFILANKINDMLESKINIRNFMTIDNSLAEDAGMKKIINRYSYNGGVETLGMGEGNTTAGEVSFTTEEYVAETTQGHFFYYDEQAMADPMVVEVAMYGQATAMTNEMVNRYFEELDKATLKQTYTKFTYDTVVDAIALMNIEEESGLFLVVGNDLKATLRKDSDFKASQMGEILYNGQIGTICGVPIVVSRAVPTGVAYLATKEAITLFTKKDSEVEQTRDANHRKNDVYMRKVNVIALTDATKLVKITKSA